MKLGDFFTQLSYGELANLSIGMDGTGDIAEDQKPRIVNFTNKALTKLYSRFSHNRDYVNITIQDGINKYRIHTQHAVTNTDVGNNNTRYITDTVDNPFTGNLIKLIALRCLGDDPEDPSTDLFINEYKSEMSVRMLTYDQFFMDEPVADQILVAEVQLDHPQLSVSVVDPNEEIFLAPVLYEALETQVAAKVFSSMGGEINEAKSMKLEAQYERICAMVESKDLLQNTMTTAHDKFINNGFV